MNNQMGKLLDLFKNSLINNGFKGEVLLDKATRILNATDNSIYEVLPQAVIQPFDFTDLNQLIELANQPPFTQFYFCARGGGTGTNGQALNDGIIIDLSRFMKRILAFDPNERTITIEPGLILSELNRFLEPHGLFFAPNVSTANRATVGGMIATDAAGKGSLIYGKTADHLLGVKVILANGETLDTLNHTPMFDDLPLIQQIIKILQPLEEEIKQRFPTLKRPLSGYNIKQCYQNGKFSFSHLIAGSEGTLGIVAAAKLKLLPIPKFKTLLVVHYASFLEALQDAKFLINFQPLAIEAIDEKVQKSAQTLPNWPILAKLLNSENKTYVSNFIEFVADSNDELATKVATLQAALNAKNANYVTINDPSQINQLWSIRSLAVGLVAKIPGAAKPIAFVEDAIVPPEHLAALVADLQRELEQANLNYAMYGHVDVGCIHVRPALNMQDPADRAKIRPVTEIFIRLLNKYQGILWGEHGKGYRGEFVPDVFGPLLYPALCQIKQLFDPENRFNPGKLTAPKQQPLFKIDEVSTRGEFDQHIPLDMQQKYTGALLCNGNGACFNQEAANVMCPSYKVTQDRIHSPKGRAMLVKEWLREKAQPNGDHQIAAHAAYTALRGCLGCKGCAGKCPTQVSIPDLSAKFLDNYHRDYKKRSLRDFSLAKIENLLPFIAKFPRLWNFIHKKRLLPNLGISYIPLFKDTDSLLSSLKSQDVQLYKGEDDLRFLATNTVVIFIDVFSGFFDREVLFATISLLRKIGYNPLVIYPRASGKALIVGGLIEDFQKNSKALAKLLNPLLLAKIPIIGLENTITLLFRDEVPKYAIEFAGKVLTLAEFLGQQVEKFKGSIASSVLNYQLLPHCTEQAILPSEATTWQRIFKALGHNLIIHNLGCCGMAGTYGHLKEQQQNSNNLFKMNWEHSLQSNEKVLATGFSCRSQVARFANKQITHPVVVIDQLYFGKV